ncbi:MAG: metallophosphoesterase, partial [Rhizobiales bacterium]|nr:metallophosphoesterase [Hyphomicrobiales bacterium]
LVWLQGTGNRRIPAVGVPSASAHAKYANEDPAGYNIFRIEGSSDNWRCETVSYQRDTDGAIRESARFRIY